MVKKLWAKFDEMDLTCVCDEHHKKCTADSGCKEYVVKFIEIDRTVEDAEEHLNQELAKVRNSTKRFQSELVKNIKKLRKI